MAHAPLFAGRGGKITQREKYFSTCLLRFRKARSNVRTLRDAREVFFEDTTMTRSHSPMPNSSRAALQRGTDSHCPRFGKAALRDPID